MKTHVGVDAKSKLIDRG